jgi:PhnB protein
MAVKPIPDGYHRVTPYLLVKGVAELVEFCKQAFGAHEVARHLHPDGTVGHAEIRIGDSMVMMGEAREEWPARPSCIYMYVTDTDATYRQAIQAGATSLSEPVDQYYGDRSGGVMDPSGNYWWISTHIEDVTPEELSRRAAEAQAKKA